jgi:hypothetical protein
MLAFSNCGRLDLNSYGNQYTRIECPVPRRQEDCPAGLQFSNGKCINTLENKNWVSSDPYLKSDRQGYRVQYTLLGKVQPPAPLYKIPSPPSPTVSPNAKSVQEYMKQIEEERKSTEQERYYAMAQNRIANEHAENIKKIESQYKIDYNTIYNSIRNDLVNKVTDIKLKMNSELESLKREHQSSKITFEQYNDQYKSIVDKYRSIYDQTVVSSQSNLDTKIQELNIKRTNNLSQNDLSRDRQLAEVDQQYASKTIPIPSTFRQSIHI